MRRRRNLRVGDDNQEVVDDHLHLFIHLTIRGARVRQELSNRLVKKGHSVQDTVQIF
jgi:hypothetical protein